VPWNRSFFLRWLTPYAVALLSLAVFLYAYGNRVAERLYLVVLSETTLPQVRLVGELLPWGLSHEAMDQRCAVIAAKIGSRVTVIAADGVVLGDSEVPSALLQNHRDHPEVRAALRDGDGVGIRQGGENERRLFERTWSQSRIDAGLRETRVLRLSLPMRSIAESLGGVRTAFWSGLALAAIAGLTPVWWASRRLADRVSRLADYSEAMAHEGNPAPITPAGDDEVGRLESHLMRMGRELSIQLQEAREEKSKLQAILAGMVEGVLVIDRTGAIALSNQRADQLFGQPLSQGEPILKYSRDPDLQALVREVAQTRNGHSLLQEITLRTGEREETLQVTASPLVAAGAEPERFVLVFHDVTELKHLERVRRDFVANVSHEIRTPLTAVRGYAETLRNGAISDPERALKFLDVIERHSERLTRLTDDLLTLSDLELGRAAMRHGKTNLNAAIDAAMDVVREKAEKRGVLLQRDLPAALSPFFADQDRLVQVLVNLLDNAVKFTEAGGRVTVGASTVPGADGPPRSRPGIEIRVSDTGIGIPSQDLPRLTERFYRVDKARSRDLGGTGLGLAIVKHIVQAHEGVLKIESELGRGTVVRVWLPVDRPIRNGESPGAV
jgi:two-component system phosphate regulon sensor histidine kinase PhoR